MNRKAKLHNFFFFFLRRGGGKDSGILLSDLKGEKGKEITFDSFQEMLPNLKESNL